VFARLCSGKLTHGKKVKQVRTGKIDLAQRTQSFCPGPLGGRRAYAGDVVGIPNHGAISIGDTPTEGEDLNHGAELRPEPAPRRLPDAMKAKKLKEALQRAAEEGVVQVFRPAGRLAGAGRRGRSLAARRAGAAEDEYGLEVLWDEAEFGSPADHRGRSQGPDEVHQRQRLEHRRRSRRAIRSIWPATTSISATPATVHPASPSPTSKTATPTARSTLSPAGSRPLG
jgi:hypothetical protein